MKRPLGASSKRSTPHRANEERRIGESLRDASFAARGGLPELSQGNLRARPIGIEIFLAVGQRLEKAGVAVNESISSGGV